MNENNKNEESGDSGTLRMLAQPPDIPTTNTFGSAYQAVSASHIV